MFPVTVASLAVTEPQDRMASVVMLELLGARDILEEPARTVLLAALVLMVLMALMVPMVLLETLAAREPRVTLDLPASKVSRADVDVTELMVLTEAMDVMVRLVFLV